MQYINKHNNKKLFIFRTPYGYDVTYGSLKFQLKQSEHAKEIANFLLYLGTDFIMVNDPKCPPFPNDHIMATV